MSICKDCLDDFGDLKYQSFSHMPGIEKAAKRLGLSCLMLNFQVMQQAQSQSPPLAMTLLHRKAPEHRTHFQAE